MFDRMVNQLSAAAATTSTTGASTTSAQAAAALMRFVPATAGSQDRTAEEPVREEEGMLDINIAEKMLKWHAEAIGRCVELSSANDVSVSLSIMCILQDLLVATHSAKNSFALLRVLAEVIANAYVETAIET